MPDPRVFTPDQGEVKFYRAVHPIAMTRILITGANGFLGSNLCHVLSRNKVYEIFGTSRSGSAGLPDGSQFFRGDLLDKTFVSDLVSRIGPDIVINTVSLVNVDLCEENPGLAEKVIVKTAGNLAEALSSSDGRLIQISSDQLFNGRGMLYSETDTPDPVNVYGKMKLRAEEIVAQQKPESLIIRTNFFGWSPEGHPPTFAEWIYSSLTEQKPITLFTDLYFSPIEVSLLVESIEILMGKDLSGILNVVGPDRCSKYDFGIALAKEFKLDSSIIHASAVRPDSFRAKRQMDLSLSIRKFERITGKKTPDLDSSLSRFYQNRNLKSVLGRCPER